MKVEMKTITFHQSCFLINVLSLAYSTANVCVKKDSCTCESSRGTINLHRIAKDDKSARFTGVRANLRYSSVHVGNVNKDRLLNHDPEFYYNPCNPFSVGTQNSSCQNVALCVYEYGDIFSDIGEQSETVFGYSDTKKQFYIKYGVSDAPNISSTVYLHCDKENKFVHDPRAHNSFTLHSPCACFNECIDQVKLSTGTILCIIFFSITLSYLIVGMLYKKAVYGATGTDLVPNVIFWTFLGTLIKEGYLFFISPCLSETAEYRRYERL